VKIGFIRFCAIGICIAASAAINAQDKTYIRLTTSDGQVVQGETSSKPGWFEVKDFSFDVVQTLNIGSQSSGAGASKITFKPFSFTVAPGRLDPKLFEFAASRTALKTMEVEVGRQATVVGAVYIQARGGEDCRLVYPIRHRGTSYASCVGIRRDHCHCADAEGERRMGSS
jgi:Type VI secretion system effector, Hcp